jgi:hypothetical protein
MADLTQLAEKLAALGCPRDRSQQMAVQLDKRARQLAEAKKRSYESALFHLLSLMAQGWNAPAQRPPKPLPETPPEP